jgi:hypothetical protein
MGRREPLALILSRLKDVAKALKRSRTITMTSPQMM